MLLFFFNHRNPCHPLGALHLSPKKPTIQLTMCIWCIAILENGPPPRSKDVHDPALSVCPDFFGWIDDVCFLFRSGSRFSFALRGWMYIFGLEPATTPFPLFTSVAVFAHIINFFPKKGGNPQKQQKDYKIGFENSRKAFGKKRRGQAALWLMNRILAIGFRQNAELQIRITNLVNRTKIQSWQQLTLYKTHHYH